MTEKVSWNLGQFTNLRGAWSKRGVVFLRKVDIPMNSIQLFANPCDHSAVTRLKNVCQLNKR